MTRSVTIAVAAAIALYLTAVLHAQEYQQIRTSDMPPMSQYYSPITTVVRLPDTAKDWRYGFPTMRKQPANLYGEPVLAGSMFNAYTSQSRVTNQLGCNYKDEFITVLFRAGPPVEYPDAGNGSLVMNTTYDRGTTWTGNSAIFNEDLRGNITDQELCARHPSIYAMNIEGTHSVATVWSNIYATLTHPVGILGELAHKAGPLHGPYQGAIFAHTPVSQTIPTRIVSDASGNLYSIFQGLDNDTDEPTGEYFLMTSTTNGREWNVDYTKPCLRESAIQPNKVYYETLSLDVSPDGSTLFLAFIVIYVKDNEFNFGDNQFGYIRSTDGGETWSNPVSYPLYSWDMGLTPIDILDGIMYPSVAVAVDRDRTPHFLISISGGDKFYPLDSTLIGELTVNVTDDSEPPHFYALAINKLPDFRRKINPLGATGPTQPTFTFWAEHEWSKSEDGTHLVAKWIDADSIFVFNPNVERTNPNAYTIDSTHDIFILRKNIDDIGNGANGWEFDEGTNTHNVINVTQSPGVDEKFTKINPIFNQWLYFLYTIMAPGEFVTGQIYADTDDLGPAELWLITHQTFVSVEDLAKPSTLSLEQNFPNPIATTRNGSTMLRFTNPAPSQVRITVYDLLGRKVATAFEGFLEPGTHSADFRPEALPAGQYIYRLESSGTTVSKIMTIVH